ncbi:MAG: 50S ribosomal protein L15 [Bacteroidota bacterium]
MKLHSLKPNNNSTKSNKRIGRGQGSGRGGTSTRGHKGAKSRSGYSRKFGFEGGQMPLQRRVPKFGFNRPQKVVYKPLNLDSIEVLCSEKNVTDIDLSVLVANGLASNNDKVKLLGRGELSKKVNVTVHKASKSSIEAIEKNGGSVTVTE